MARLTQAWEAALEQFAGGKRGANSVVSASHRRFLATQGLTAQELYDAIEDHAAGGEPVLATFAAEAALRREVFLEVQDGATPATRVRTEDLPPKVAEAHGIPWLPRIVAKAHAKLHGQLPLDIMYGCGGDRKFFRKHDIHPVELLQAVRRAGDDLAAVEAWVAARAKR